MINQNIHVNAAKTILRECLSLPPKSEIIVVSDKKTMPVSKILVDTAIHIGVQPLMFYFTPQMQTKIGEGDIPASLDSALKDVAATLICSNDAPKYLPFRDVIRRCAWDTNRKVAHMPGITLESLLLADVDYKTLSNNCEMIALALAKGHQLEIISYDHTNSPQHLWIDLDPWKRLPIISDGIIQDGAWGNVPSGETYIAPPEGNAHGAVVINGSFKGYCMQPGEELILYFEDGRLADWSPRNSKPARKFHKDFVEFSQSKGDKNWNNLAEIGFGVNPRVNKLTGYPLLDEKKYGSIHIALGDNTDMGGNVHSGIHCDMVCLFPKVLIDGKTILEKNNIVLKSQDWQEDYTDIYYPSSWHENMFIFSTVKNTETKNGYLKRLWDTSAGRVCSVQVGSNEISTKSASLYKLIKKRNGQPIRIKELVRLKSALSVKEILQITYLLKNYGLIDACK